MFNKKMRVFAMLPIAFVEIIPYFIIIICGSKMVKYVNLHTGFDQNMKRLLKQLTETLIILVCFKLILVCFELILVCFKLILVCFELILVCFKLILVCFILILIIKLILKI